ncbi:uncharacterized protein SAPINGB_P004494 [Magnusiomyces paraingens]|uniref:RING-type E3 ubiquitin transferase n=1 Tax=Magnusiomyces paraingens TaxID=2606893 RepID=A0A5E8BX06_9ASCO|nr:uncharacterized protein SAPINGB_P004494 [Saprochaete ingens]VVT55234.1 unnamed protein product [Saprochaete ingens]
MEINRGLFLVLLVFLLFFTPTGNPPHLTSPDEKAHLNLYFQLQRNETELLKTSTYRYIPGNITGISYPQNETGFIPTSIETIAKSLWHSESTQDQIEKQITNIQYSEDNDDESFQKLQLVFYGNYSGLFHGLWEKPLISKLFPRDMQVPEIFRHSDNDEEEALPSATNNSSLIHEPAHQPLSQKPTMNKILSAPVEGNITESEGNISFSIEEAIPKDASNPNITIITMRISITNTEESSSYTINLKGLHIKPTGNVVLTTESLKYSGLQYLPHLVLDEKYFEESKELMLQYLNNTLTKDEYEEDYLVFEDSEMAAESCEFVLYGHFKSVHLSANHLRDIEDEIENPVGRPLKKIPSMVLESIIYSPDCAFAVQAQDSQGEKYEQYWSRIRTVVVACVLLIIAQAYLLARQMKDTNTPSYMCKVSFYTIAMNSVIDGSVWMASFASSFVEDLALSFMAIAFLSFALTSMFEMRYLVKIYQAQMSERQADVRVRDAMMDHNGTATFSVLSDGSFVTPSPRPQQQPSGDSSILPISEPPSNNEPQEDLSERAIGSKIYTWFYFSLIGFISSALIAATWPLYYRRIYEFVVVLGFYSMWVPQIQRNISRGFRRSFLWQFIVGSSALRLIPVLYFTLVSNNILRHHYDPTLAIATIIWLTIQIVVLYLQNVFGPRFFLPKGYLPALYDYHPILTQSDDIEDGVSISESAAPVPKKFSRASSIASTNASVSSKLLGGPSNTNDSVGTSGNLNNSSSFNEAAQSVANKDLVSRPTVDCAICMTPVELVITPKASSAAFVSSPALILARRKYMVTPCRHVFHTECMEQWMRTRLQCPICRNPLPPV